MNEQLATRYVHAGEIDDPHGSPPTPIYPTTTFKFPYTAAILDVVRGATMLRLSVGLEDADDLIADLSQALD